MLLSDCVWISTWQNVFVVYPSCVFGLPPSLPPSLSLSLSHELPPFIADHLRTTQAASAVSAAVMRKGQEGKPAKGQEGIPAP
jgi:hypothetical protein